MKAMWHTSDLFPHISIPQSDIRNNMLKMRRYENNDFGFVSALRLQRRRGTVPYLQRAHNESTGVLNPAVWAYKESRYLALRYDDISFWESSHNTTKYAFELSTITVVDREKGQELFCSTLQCMSL